MAAISALLNPAPIEATALPSPSLSTTSLQPSHSMESSASPPFKKQKLAKDAAIFTKHKARGEVRYLPFEEYDDALLAELQKFEINPLGHIREFRRHIPYSSDKKTFLERTGRDAFEVYQYEFKVPNWDKVFVVMWDYNIGLVRITPFFKCLQYSKTVPSKMMNINPGLKQICHSITGGSLAAQGYWMPFEAAKCVATTFCYDIRYALVPIFGPDFPASCVKPTDDRFGYMVINPRIIRQCTEQAREFHNELSRAGSATPSSVTDTPRIRPGKWIAHRPKGCATSDAASDSGTDRGDGGYLPSPSSILINGPPPRSTPEDVTLPPPRDLLTTAALSEHDRTLFQSPAPGYDDAMSAKESLSTSHHESRQAPKMKVEAAGPVDGAQDEQPVPKTASPEYHASSPGVKPTREPTREPIVCRLPPLYSHDNCLVSRSEARAAYTLLTLYAADDKLQPDGPKGRKRRASG